MLMPSPISVAMAGTPASVPGTLTIRFGRSTAAHKRRASTTVACVSFAR